MPRFFFVTSIFFSIKSDSCLKLLHVEKNNSAKKTIFPKKKKKITHVFKKCESAETGHECLVTLKKPEINENFPIFLCNEFRLAVKNKDFAKFRCNGLFVVKIFDLVSKVNLNAIVHKTSI
jgi:hypothetical protein